MPRKSRRLPGGRVRRMAGSRSGRGRRGAPAKSTAAPVARRQTATTATRADRSGRRPAGARDDSPARISAKRRTAAGRRLAPLDVAAANLTYIRADLTRIGIISAGLLAVLIVLTIVLR